MVAIIHEVILFGQACMQVEPRQIFFTSESVGIPSEELRHMIFLLNVGFSATNIARMLGVSLSTVRQCRSDLTVDFEIRLRYTAEKSDTMFTHNKSSIQIDTCLI